MSLIWALPLGFAALAALLVPLLLHLDRQRSLQTLTFAAMRWIGDRHRPRRSWRLSEWLLLVLRLLLLACIALWLAQPLLRGVARDAQHWLAVAPGTGDADIASAAHGMDRRVWLAPGFPPLEQPSASSSESTSSLLRELDAQLPADDTLRVLAPRELGGLDARAIELSRDVDWRIADASVAPAAALQNESRTLAVRHDDAGDPSLRVVRAAVQAWAESTALSVESDEGPATQSLPPQFDALIWIGGEPDASALAQVEAGATLLQIPDVPILPEPSAAAARKDFWPPDDTRTGRGRRLRLAVPLDPQYLPQLQSAAFAEELHRVLFGNGPAPARALAQHVRPTTGTVRIDVQQTPLRPWLAWLIAALFLFERTLASGRRLARAA